MLIIGCGNLQRGDDAAGVLVAQQLRSLGVEAKICGGEASELLDAWSRAEDVLVIDAVVTGAPAGTVHRWNNPDSITFGKSVASTHGFGLAEAVGLALAIKRLPASLCICGIEGKNFAIGTAVSPEVKSAVDEVVKAIAVEMKVKR